MNTASQFGGRAARPPQLRHVTVIRPFTWIRKGWDDLLRHPAASMAYGVLVSLLAAVVIAYPSHPFVIAAAMIGFMLVGPVMAAGLTELSRQGSKGLEPDFDISLKTLRRHRRPLFHYATTLLVLSIIWFGLSGVMLYELFGSVGPRLEDTVLGDMFRTLSVGQMIAYLAIGGLLTGIVFVVSVVTVPMIIDRDVDAMTAMRTSLRAVLAADFPAMLVWACICMLMVSVGFATFLLGMVVVFPLLGHATWYAYVDLVE